MFRSHYSEFAAANPNELHFAAHSHHWWPDVTRQAVLACWDDAARFVDSKWEHLYSEIIPKAQRYVAEWVGGLEHQQIVFGTNTHEFVVRLLSCFPCTRPVRVLATQSEFHSFSRQIKRLIELGVAEVHLLDTHPFDSFEDRLKQAYQTSHWDMVFLSHIFFDSGWQVDLERLYPWIVEGDAMVVIDGYHSFSAIPKPLKGFGDRFFFLGGGYKYAQSGEGACFLSVPTICPWYPSNTGWFAEFDQLSTRPGESVGFASNAQRFAGATFDPTGLYRLNAVGDWLQQLGLNIQGVHHYVRDLQRAFLARLPETSSSNDAWPTIARGLHRQTLITLQAGTSRSDEPRYGHFFALELDTAEAANQLCHWLWNECRIRTDVRGNRLRIGFGMYQTHDDVDAFFDRITHAQT